jgi:HD-GYP domain-containing protein (c-di-GMP phosphodiesterase class II)
MMVGRRLSLGAEQLDELRRAAELHDIGKVGIPDAILEKPGPLTLAEWEFVRQHAVLGERILGAAPAMRPIAAIVRSTHERWDGTGYPDGLAGDEIPLASRIVCACDAWEAMTSGRTYREPTDADRARDELRRESGRQFDPAVVEILLEESARAAQPPAEEAALFPAGDAQHGGVGHVAGLGGGDAAGDRGDGDGGAGGHRERL